MTAIHLYAKIKVGVSLVNISIAITQPRILRFRSNLVQTLIAWQPMYNRRLRLIFNGQDHSVKTSSSFSVNQGRWIQWRCQNLDRKLQNSRLCVYAEYKIGQNSPERLARPRAVSSCNAFAIATFCTLCLKTHPRCF